MNLKEYAKENDITLDEAKEKTGLTHWKQEVVEADASPADTPDVTKEDIVEEVMDVVDATKTLLEESKELMKMLMADGLTPDNAMLGINMIGEKSKYYTYLKVLKTLLD